MPELPEVEVVRRGLAEHVVGRTVAHVSVHHERAVRRHVAGQADFAARLVGRPIQDVLRRGKYLWLALHHDEALLAHLGMSGQLLVRDGAVAPEKHLRVRIRFADDGPELRFVDQRTFGGLAIVGTDAAGLPVPVAHIARDPMDPDFDEDDVVLRLRRRQTGIKRALLDQTLVSGIGNIYADEALWHAHLHYARPTDALSRQQARTVLAAARAVMAAALNQGGTSFDALYVNVDGESGYFERELASYGRAGLPCRRCGSLIVREPFMNRSSFRCPRCQPRPRRPHG